VRHAIAEMAAFLSMVIIHLLDFNDAHLAGHLSDMLRSLLVLAESPGADD
jgi:2-methylcitrate dehydratase PrpD